MATIANGPPIFGSPTGPVAPPPKKQRSGYVGGSEQQNGGGDPISMEADEILAKRRTELQRLQQMRTGKPTPGGGSVLDRARSQLSAAEPRSTEPPIFNHGGPRVDPRSILGPPHSASNGSKSAAGAPPIPAPNNQLYARQSDIFPSATKSQTQAQGPPPNKPSAPAGLAPPVPASAPGKSAKDAKAEQVARRLDASFAQGYGSHPDSPVPGPPTSFNTARNRAKSAPPERPPAPPRAPPPRKAAEAPVSGEKPKRSHVSRPPPMMSPNSLMSPNSKPPVAKTSEKPMQKQDSTPVAKTNQKPMQKQDSTPVAKTNQKPMQKQDSTPVAKTNEKPMQKQDSTPPPLIMENGGTTKTAANGTSASTKAAEPTASGTGSERRDLLKNLRQAADTPSKPVSTSTPPLTANADTSASHQDSTALKELQEKLLKQEKAKTEALRKVARLESELQRERETKSEMTPQSAGELQALLQLADTKGEAKAIKWARDIVSNTPTQDRQLSFLSPTSPSRNISSVMTPVSPPMRKRVPTPHPKRSSSAEKVVSSIDERSSLMEATKSIPHEYTTGTDLATLTIRRPYGIATERELWFDVGQLSSRKYETSADVRDPSTLEVVAEIQADGSFLALNGNASVRHRRNNDDDWKEFGDVDELGKPLGSVSYIDSDANEKEYLLDDIFEGLIYVREQYCSSVLSLNVALQDRKISIEEAVAEAVKEANRNMKQQLEMMEQNMENTRQASTEQEVPKPPMADACVGTEDLKFPAVAVETRSEKKVEKPKPEPIPDDASSSDVLSSFVAFVFSTFFLLVWTVVVKVPLKIVSFTLLTLVSMTILSIIWFHFADDYGAHSMGAGIDFMHNRPGIL